MGKVWYRSKTAIFAIFVVLMGILDQLDIVDIKANLTSILLMVGVPETKVGGIVSLVGAVFFVLRLVSQGKVTLSTPKEE